MLDILTNNPVFDTIKTIFAFIVAVGILITVHELGHFWVARRCGVFVQRFSLGFGKRLWGRVDKQGTEFIISLIPLGGYVRMLDERVGDVAPSQRHQAFNNKTISQRAAIISAGPLANFLFAFLAYWLALMLGIPGLKPIIGDVIPDSIAAQAGLSPSMKITSIAGSSIQDWSSALIVLMEQRGQPQVEITFSSTVNRIDEKKWLDLTHWTLEVEKQSPLKSLGIIPVAPVIELGEIVANSPAEHAGLRKGDRIVKIDGQLVKNSQTFVQTVQRSAQVALSVEAEREGQFLFLTLVPDNKRVNIAGEEKEIGSIGVNLLPPRFADEDLVTVSYGPLAALYPAGEMTWRILTLVGKEFGNLIVGERNLKSLSGPGTIAKEARASAEGGVVSFLIFLMFISVNLGVINLFPLPVLDGGHLLFLAIEKITGRPVSERVQDYSFRIGAILLILLMGLTFFN